MTTLSTEITQPGRKDEYSPQLVPSGYNLSLILSWHV